MEGGLRLKGKNGKNSKCHPRSYETCTFRSFSRLGSSLRFDESASSEYAVTEANDRMPKRLASLDLPLEVILLLSSSFREPLSYDSMIDLQESIQRPMKGRPAKPGLEGPEEITATPGERLKSSMAVIRLQTLLYPTLVSTRCRDPITTYDRYSSQTCYRLEQYPLAGVNVQFIICTLVS